MMTRQDYRRANVAKGLCQDCGKRPLDTKIRCFECNDKATIRQRDRLRYKSWIETGMGRRPLEFGKNPCK